MTPPNWLEELKAVAEAATQGEWKHELERYSAQNVIGIKPHDDRWVAHCQPAFNGYANAEHIATFDPTAVLKLLAMLKEAHDALSFISSEKESCSGDYAKQVAKEALEFLHKKVEE